MKNETLLCSSNIIIQKEKAFISLTFMIIEPNLIIEVVVLLYLSNPKSLPYIFIALSIREIVADCMQKSSSTSLVRW
jgi:hypothetical protein